MFVIIWDFSAAGFFALIGIILVCIPIYCFAPSTKEKRKHNQWCLDYVHRFEPNFSYLGFKSAKTMPAIIFFIAAAMFLSFVGAVALGYEASKIGIIPYLLFWSPLVAILGFVTLFITMKVRKYAWEMFDEYLDRGGFTTVTHYQTEMFVKGISRTYDWDAYEKSNAARLERVARFNSQYSPRM